MKKSNQIFSWRRCFLLCKEYLLVNKLGFILGFGIIAGITFILSMLNARTPNAISEIHFYIYMNILIIGGLYLTCGAFLDLGRRGTAIPSLLTPGSTLEKLCARFFFPHLGFLIIFTVFYCACSYLAESLNQVMFNRHFPAFNPFSLGVLTVWRYYMMTNSIFLVGAIYFKSKAFFKTSLVLILVLVILFPFIFFGSRTIFKDLRNMKHKADVSKYYTENSYGYLGDFNEEIDNPSIDMIERYHLHYPVSAIANTIVLFVLDDNKYWNKVKLLDAQMYWSIIIVNILYFIVIPLLCWMTAYHRFREKEIA